MYSGFDPNTPSFPSFNSQFYCGPYFVIPFNLIVVHILPVVVFVKKGDGHAGKRSHDESALFIPFNSADTP